MAGLLDIVNVGEYVMVFLVEREKRLGAVCKYGIEVENMR